MFYIKYFFKTIFVFFSIIILCSACNKPNIIPNIEKKPILPQIANGELTILGNNSTNDLILKTSVTSTENTVIINTNSNNSDKFTYCIDNLNVNISTDEFSIPFEKSKLPNSSPIKELYNIFTYFNDSEKYIEQSTDTITAEAMCNGTSCYIVFDKESFQPIQIQTVDLIFTLDH